MWSTFSACLAVFANGGHCFDQFAQSLDVNSADLSFAVYCLFILFTLRISLPDLSSQVSNNLTDWMHFLPRRVFAVIMVTNLTSLNLVFRQIVYHLQSLTRSILRELLKSLLVTQTKAALHHRTPLFCDCSLINISICPQAIGCIGANRMNEKLLNLYWHILISLLIGDLIVGGIWLVRYNYIFKNLKSDLSYRIDNDYGFDLNFQVSNYRVSFGFCSSPSEACEL